MPLAIIYILTQSGNFTNLKSGAYVVIGMTHTRLCALTKADAKEVASDPAQAALP
jgi:hypothetical protein